MAMSDEESLRALVVDGVDLVSSTAPATAVPPLSITQGQTQLLMQILNQLTIDSALVAHGPSSPDTSSSDLVAADSHMEANVQRIAEVVVRSLMGGIRQESFQTVSESAKRIKEMHDPSAFSPSSEENRDSFLRMPLRSLGSIRRLDEQTEAEDKKAMLAVNPSFDRYSNRDFAIRLPHRNQSISFGQSIEKADVGGSPSTAITTTPEVTAPLSRADASRDAAPGVPLGERESLQAVGKVQNKTVISDRAMSGINCVVADRMYSQISAASSERDNEDEGVPSMDSFSTWATAVEELLVDSILSQQGSESRRTSDEARFERDIVTRLSVIRGLDGMASSMRREDELRSVASTESVTDATDDERWSSSASGRNRARISRKDELLETPRRGEADESVATQAQNCLNLMIEYLRRNRVLSPYDDAVSVMSDLTGTTERFLEDAVAASLRAVPDTPPKVPLRIDSVKGSTFLDETTTVEVKGIDSSEGTDEGSKASKSQSTGTGTVSSNCNAKSRRGRRKRLVDFSTVQIRFYERIMCENPACTSGPSVGIGWNYADEEILAEIGQYESSRDWSKRSGIELCMSRERREKMLRDWGYTDRDIASGVRELNRLKACRRQTVNNLGVERVEEAVELLTRKVKKALFLHREQEKLEEKLKSLQPRSKKANLRRGDVKAESSSESLSVSSAEERRLATAMGELVEI
jgi:hypothetical protein